jgi:pSer/pThr/pTyr-binding forkhead associated (FHA) protein
MRDAFSAEPSTSTTRPSPVSSGSSGTRTSPLRLVVVQSQILSRKQRVAVLDTYPEISIGRDISPDPNAPRVRLKEMVVSKFHASIFFSFASRIWSIVDLGSVHGTEVNGSRLSGARQSSQPRELRHSDKITVGTTTFSVHAHRDGLPCTDCVVSGSADNEIPLFDPRSKELGAPKGKAVAVPQSKEVSPPPSQAA